MSARSLASPRAILVRMMSSEAGRNTAAKPVGFRWPAPRRHARVADKAGPVGQCLGSRNRTGRQVLTQAGPRFHRGGKAFRDRRNVEQRRFASLSHGQPAKPGRIHARGAEQLGCRAEVVEVVRVLAKAKGNADFFVGNRRVVRRERRIKVTPIMRRTSLHRGLEKPLGKTISCPSHHRQTDGQT